MLGREARQTTRSTHEPSALRRSRVGTRAWQRGGACPIRAEGDGMNSPATSTYLPPLEVNHEREGVGQELQTTLHELVDLSLIGKQLHWAVVGPLFRPLHLQLDELVDSWRELADTVAERAVALGFVPDGQAKAVAAGSQLAPVTPAALEDHLVVRELTHRVAEVSEEVRELEKEQWMLRAQLGEHA